MLTLQRPMVSARPSRQTTVVRANMMNDVGAGFTQIFRPLLSGRAVPWAESSGFQGKSARKLRSSDNWSTPAAKASGQPEEPKQEGAMDYMNKAAESVLAHNFSGDKTEPATWKDDATSIGWKGEIHTRHRSGFHSIKPTVQAQAKVAGAEEVPVEEPQVDEEGNVVTFLNKAAESVVAHNFTGDKTEPQSWKGQGETSTGWKGDIHTRKREGFHSIKD